MDDAVILVGFGTEEDSPPEGIKPVPSEVVLPRKKTVNYKALAIKKDKELKAWKAKAAEKVAQEKSQTQNEALRRMKEKV